MTYTSSPLRLLTVMTASLFLIAVWLLFELGPSKVFAALPVIETQNQPTIGPTTATIHIVAFEEPRCTECRHYHEEIFPRIKREFIDTGKVRYTSIVVSFLPHSMELADAMACVYHQSPDSVNESLYFALMDRLYRYQPTDELEIKINALKLAKETSPKINLKQLSQCIEKQSYRPFIIRNTEYARSVMGGQIRTPTIYVNGMKLKGVSYEEITRAIEQLDKS